VADAGGRTLATAFVQIRPKGDNLGPDLRQQTEAAGRNAGTNAGHHFGTAMKTAIKAAGLALAVGAAFVGVKAIGFLREATAGASDLNETVSKAANIFPKSTAELEKFASVSASAFGLSRQQALEGAAGFGNFFNQIGVGEKQSLKMSKALIQLSADLGSFDNADPAQVMASFQSATRGEYDSLQQFIPTVNAAAIQTEALRITHKRSVKELTDADKALALYNVAMRDAGKATGDFARTQDGLANQQRIAAAGIKDLKDRIGTALLPVVTEFAHIFTAQLLPALNAVWTKYGPGATRALQALATGISAMMAAFREGDVTSDGFVGTMERIGVAARNIGPTIRGVIADVKAWFAAQGGGQGGELSVNLKSAADSAKELLPVVKEFISSLPQLSDVVNVAATAMGFLADHTEELKAMMPLLVAGFIAYKGAQVAAHLAALAAVPTKIAEVIINRQLVASNRALIASRVQLTATTEVATVATAANTGVESVGVLTRARAVAAMVAQRVAMVAVRTATIAWTAVQWLLNVALTANPIGLIIIAIAALVAVVVLIATKTTWFQTAWKFAWGGIKAAAKAVVDWFVNTAWPFLQKVWDGIVLTVRVAIAIWTGYMNLIRSIVQAVFRFIADFISDRIAFVVAVVRRVREIVTLFRDAFNRVNAAIVDRVSAAIAFVRSIPGRIRSAVGNLGSLLYNAGRDIIQGLLNGITGMIDKLKGQLQKLTNLLPDWKGPLSRDLTILAPSGEAVMAGFMRGIDTKVPTLQAKLRDITNSLAQPIPGAGGSAATAGAADAALRLHPADLRQLAEMLGEVMYRAIGLSGSGDARSSQLFVRGA
jgi:hypothetical protein